MSATVWIWLAAAVLLFWSLGAYNRLVRQRALVINSFAAVDQRMAQAVDLLHEAVAADDRVATSARDTSDNPQEAQGTVSRRAGLQAAAAQFDVALGVARKQSLDASAVSALQAAYTTAQAVWERYRVPISEPDSSTLQRAWEDNAHVVREAQAGFNTAVSDYNAAIAQFPASLLAHFFGFRPAAWL